MQRLLQLAELPTELQQSAVQLIAAYAAEHMFDVVEGSNDVSAEAYLALFCKLAAGPKLQWKLESLIAVAACFAKRYSSTLRPHFDRILDLDAALSFHLSSYFATLTSSLEAFQPDSTIIEIQKVSHLVATLVHASEYAASVAGRSNTLLESLASTHDLCEYLYKADSEGENTAACLSSM